MQYLMDRVGAKLVRQAAAAAHAGARIQARLGTRFHRRQARKRHRRRGIQSATIAAAVRMPLFSLTSMPCALAHCRAALSLQASMRYSMLILISLMETCCPFRTQKRAATAAPGYPVSGVAYLPAFFTACVNCSDALATCASTVSAACLTAFVNCS